MARDLVVATGQERGIHLPADNPDLRLEPTDDDEPVVYCAQCGSGSSARYRIIRC